jgi:Uma2 family endonuclease
METEVPKKLFTVDEYSRMAEAGILGPNDRVELINGEIIQMSPVGIRHIACVNRATALLVTTFAGRGVISVQNPIELDIHNEPQPDLTVMKHRPDFYATKRLTASDTLLVIEVADTTRWLEMNVKVPIYAAKGISEVWIEDLQHDRILVYRDPAGDRTGPA